MRWHDWRILYTLSGKLRLTFSLKQAFAVDRRVRVCLHRPSSESQICCCHFGYWCVLFWFICSLVSIVHFILCSLNYVSRDDNFAECSLDAAAK